MSFRKQTVELARIPVLAPQTQELKRAQELKREALQALALSFKRILDIALAAAMLLVLMPVMIVIATAIALDGGPVIYRHRRIGQNGKTFDCLKFRTMILDAEDCLNEYLSYHPDEYGEWERERKLSHDPRITPIGRLLRASSADELPQLLNVIAGSMSLVGPRPVTASELALYGESADLYKSVRPGITGPWQISGRNDLSYDTRILLDSRYVREWSLKNDVNVLLRTPAAVLSRSGAR